MPEEHQEAGLNLRNGGISSFFVRPEKRCCCFQNALIMRAKILIGLSCLSLIAAVVFTGCQSSKMDAQIRKVDSLMDKVKEAENTMVIDMNTIKARYDTIQRMDSFIQNNYDQKPTNRFSTMMNRYQAIESNYKNFIKNYELIEYENDKHRDRLKDLKKDLVEGNVSKEKFRSLYEEEQKIIQEHLNRTKKLVNSVTEIEKAYRRTQDKVSREYEQLKAQQTQ
jgi:leucyl aminopeptidase